MNAGCGATLRRRRSSVPVSARTATWRYSSRPRPTSGGQRILEQRVRPEPDGRDDGAGRRARYDGTPTTVRVDHRAGLRDHAERSVRACSAVDRRRLTPDDPVRALTDVYVRDLHDRDDVARDCAGRRPRRATRCALLALNPVGISEDGRSSSSSACARRHHALHRHPGVRPGPQSSDRRTLVEPRILRRPVQHSSPARHRGSGRYGWSLVRPSPRRHTGLVRRLPPRHEGADDHGRESSRRARRASDTERDGHRDLPRTTARPSTSATGVTVQDAVTVTDEHHADRAS